MRFCALRAATRLNARTSFQTARSVTTMSLKLYANPACPWAQRGWLALVETKTPFTYETISLGPEKPQSYVELYRSIIPDPSVGAKVPVLVDGDLKLTESAVVAEYVASKYTQHMQLIPSDPGQAARAKLWVDVFSPSVYSPVMQMLEADTREGLEAARAKLAHGLQVADAFLRLHGSEEGGSYVLGGTYSLAEVLTTSLAQRAVIFSRAHRDTDIHAMIKHQGLDRLERWMKAALERPSAKETLPAEEELVEHSRHKFLKALKD